METPQLMRDVECNVPHSETAGFRAQSGTDVSKDSSTAPHLALLHHTIIGTKGKKLQVK